MLSKSEKISLSEEVLESRIFIKSPASSSLLRYLVRATLENIDLKESTIGIEFLGKKFSSEKDNAHVRVNIYNLRKKLQKYYSEEGANSDWKIEIEKGQYKVKFLASADFNTKAKRNFSKNGILYILLLFILFSLFSHRFLPLKPRLWKPFFTNDRNTTLFIGDVIGFMGRTATGNWGWNRDFLINTQEDFYALLDRQPDLKGKLLPANYTYLTRMGPFATKAFSRLFQRHNTDFDIQLSTSCTFSEIKSGNAIYVGPFKNDNKFLHLFNERNPHFHIQNGELIYTNNLSSIDTVYNLSIEGSESELAVVSRFPGLNNTEYFLFFSDHDMGVQATVEYFTQQNTLKEFAREHPSSFSGSFTALFLVKGRERTNITLELILLENITK